MKAKISAVAAEYLAFGDDQQESPGQFEIGIAALALEDHDPMTKEQKREVRIQIGVMRALKENAPPCINCNLCVVRYCALTGAVCDKFMEYTDNGLAEMTKIERNIYEANIQEKE